MRRTTSKLIILSLILGFTAFPTFADEVVDDIDVNHSPIVIEQEQDVLEQDSIIDENLIIEEDLTIEEEPIEEKPVEPVVPGTGIYLEIGNPNAFINGQKYILDANPKVVKNTTLVPLRFIADALNVQVEWKQDTKQINISKDGQVVVLQLDSPMAKVDGKNVSIGIAPIVENDRTLLPLRFISEQFRLEVIYNSEIRSITLLPLTPPVAQFRFEFDEYVAGQVVSTINQSYSPNGEPIVETLWEINNNRNLRTKDLSTMFSKPGAGTYSIKLRVRNSKNVWSDWAEQIITIGPHPAPQILYVASSKDEWAQGEELEFTHKVRTEPWEKIVEERWTYRPKGISPSEATVGKPRALFHEGTYIVTLQVKDSYGSWSEAQSTEIEITKEIKSTELEYKFNNLTPGEIVDNFSKFNFQNYEPVKDFSVLKGGPRLLVSNSPEIVLQKGILYADETIGETRILYHHKNGIVNNPENTRFVIIVENKGTEVATVQKLKQGVMGPSDDILHLGQQAGFQYFNSFLNERLVLEPNQKQYIYDTGNRNWKYDQTFSGLLEFSSDQPVYITVAAVDKNFKLEEIESLAVLPRDGIHTRGTFEQANIYYNILLPEERPSKIMFGQREDHMDSWTDGYDALTGDIVQNKGNYGMVYQLNLTAKNKTGVTINPRGTSFKGVFQWQDDKSYLAPERGMFIGSQKSAIAGILNGNITRKLNYMLPNGSSAPVLFNFIPQEFWDDYEMN